MAVRAAADVRRAHRGWARSAETLAIHQRAVGLAEKQLRLAELRYERGLAGNFDVVDAENNLFQAQSALIGAEIERGLAALRLRRAAGALDPREFLP
ncbi:MAG: TolC family protein, partial [Acidobacteria bacterium]|nr:TolC family protein [Acidobacteriota bacterium]